MKVDGHVAEVDRLHDDTVRGREKLRGPSASGPAAHLRKKRAADTLQSQRREMLQTWRGPWQPGKQPSSP